MSSANQPPSGQPSAGDPYARSVPSPAPETQPWSAPAPSGPAPQQDPFAQPAPQAAPASPASQHPGQNGPSQNGPSQSGPGQGAPGVPPAHAPAGGPRPAPGADLGTDIGAAFSFAWSAFRASIATFLVPGFVYLVATFVVTVLAMAGGFAFLFARIDPTSSTMTGEDVTTLILMYVIIFAVLLLLIPVMLLWYSGVNRAGGAVLDGRRPTLKEGFIGTGRVIATLALAGVLVFVGCLLLYLPGLALGVITMFAVPAAVRGASPMAAIRESWGLVRANLGTALVSYLILMALASLGGMLIITLPLSVALSMLFTLGMYERLSRRELPDPEQTR